MVETKIIMNTVWKIAYLVAAMALSVFGTMARDAEKSGKGTDGKGEIVFSWSRNQMNGSRTGVTCPGADNIPEALGTVVGSVYNAPNGRIFKGGCVPDVAGILIAAQPAMADVKEVVGHSTEQMSTAYPESALSDWFVDNLMKAVEKKSGKRVDMGIVNFGGIRVDMPEGDILKDDIMSMFPFKNNIVYVALKGSDVRAILEDMAASRFQVLGGVRVVAHDGKLVSAEIGGEPIDDDRVYGLATISFLLNGGDDLKLARNALEVIEYPEIIYDVMIDVVRDETAAGRDIVYHTDGRVRIL